jgi:hypothetical protein
VGIQGKTHWMPLTVRSRPKTLLVRLQALIKDADKKILLVLWNVQMHHSELVRAWVAEQRERIGLFPPFSEAPQRNAEQRLSADLKQELGMRASVRAKIRLPEAVNDHMALPEQNPERAMGHFQHRWARHAALDVTGSDK